MIREYKVLISLTRVVRSPSSWQWFSFFINQLNSNSLPPAGKFKYLLKVVKKDLSPDWEDASVKLADVEVGIFIPRPHHSVRRQSLYSSIMFASSFHPKLINAKG